MITYSKTIILGKLFTHYKNAANKNIYILTLFLYNVVKNSLYTNIV